MQRSATRCSNIEEAYNLNTLLLATLPLASILAFQTCCHSHSLPLSHFLVEWSDLVLNAQAALDLLSQRLSVSSQGWTEAQRSMIFNFCVSRMTTVSSWAPMLVLIVVRQAFSVAGQNPHQLQPHRSIFYYVRCISLCILTALAWLEDSAQDLPLLNLSEDNEKSLSLKLMNSITTCLVLLAPRHSKKPFGVDLIYLHMDLLYPLSQVFTAPSLAQEQGHYTDSPMAYLFLSSLALVCSDFVRPTTCMTPRSWGLSMSLLQEILYPGQRRLDPSLSMPQLPFINALQSAVDMVWSRFNGGGCDASCCAGQKARVLEATACCLVGILSLIRVSAEELLHLDDRPAGLSSESARLLLFRSFHSFQCSGLADLLLLPGGGGRASVAGDSQVCPPLALTLHHGLLTLLLQTTLDSLVPLLKLLSDLPEESPMSVRRFPYGHAGGSDLQSTSTTGALTEHRRLLQSQDCEECVERATTAAEQLAVILAVKAQRDPSDHYLHHSSGVGEDVFGVWQAHVLFTEISLGCEALSELLMPIA